MTEEDEIPRNPDNEGGGNGKTAQFLFEIPT